MSLHKYDGGFVREYWLVVLPVAKADNVDFYVNDGARTMEMQEQRVRDHGLYSASNPTGAAYPNEDAPHINHEQQNHALDCLNRDRTQNTGAAHLCAWLREQGASSAVYQGAAGVPNEPWHMQISLADLTKLYERFNDPYKGLSTEERKHAKAYDEERARLKKAGIKTSKLIGELRKWMKTRRKTVWKAAHSSGHTARERAAFMRRWVALRKRSGL